MSIEKKTLLFAQALGGGGGITPTGNQDISTLDEYDVSTKATARVSAEERAKIIPENIPSGTTILGVPGSAKSEETVYGELLSAEWGTPVYSIMATITNGTATGDAQIQAGGTASVTIVPSSGYSLPSTLTVSGATSSYDSSTGVITLSNPIGAVTISAACVPSGYAGQLKSDMNLAYIYIDRTPSGTPDYAIDEGETKAVMCETFVIVATNWGELWRVIGTPSNCTYEQYSGDGYTGLKVMPNAQNWYLVFENYDD